MPLTSGMPAAAHAFAVAFACVPAARRAGVGTGKGAPARRRRAGTGEAAAMAELDVVTYPLAPPACTRTLGVVTEVLEGGEFVVVTPLECAEEGEEVSWFVLSEVEEPSGVLSVAEDGVVPLEDVQYSQRMDADRTTNPHGEHAHDVWGVDLNALDPGLLVLRCDGA